MKNFFALVAIFISVYANFSSALSVVADVSPSHIEIDSRFRGKRILIFGALIKASDNVVVIIHGPEKNISASKKTKVFGIWTNSTKFELKNIPQFYSLSYIKDRYLELNDALRKDFEFFLDAKSEFMSAFFDHKIKNRLYQVNNDIKIINDHLFRCTVDLPSNIPKGNYSIEIIALSSTKIIGMTSIPLFVNKVGIESWLFDMHFIHPFYYAFLAIFGALFVGWASTLPKL